MPLVQHVFGIRPDAVGKTVSFAPHMPDGWEDMSIEDLPVGTNVMSFAAARTGKGLEYTIESRDSAWTLVLRAEAAAGARYYLNGRPVVPGASGIRMTGSRNHVLVVR